MASHVIFLSNTTREFITNASKWQKRRSTLESGALRRLVSLKMGNGENAKLEVRIVANLFVFVGTETFFPLCCKNPNPFNCDLFVLLITEICFLWDP